MARQRKKRQRQGGAPGTPRSAAAPARAKDYPFCAFLSAHGETCEARENLVEVLSMQGPPRMVLVACPVHLEEVRRQALAFVQRSLLAPQMMVLRYHGQTVQVVVAGVQGKNEC